MTYNPEYPGIQNVGWTCPKCGRSYAPSVSQCLYCNDRRVIYATHVIQDPKKFWIEGNNSWINEMGIFDDD